MKLKTLVDKSINDKFYTFVIKLIYIYGIHGVSANIHKSPFITIDILMLIYDNIITSIDENINLMLNNLFIKVIQFNIGNEIKEKELEEYLDMVNIKGYDNHICPYNYHNYMESTCEFSIFRSFSNCLYFYINDTHISFNSHISDSFAKKYLSPENFRKFKENIVKVTPSIYYTNVECRGTEKNGSLYERIDENISVNNIIWDDIQTIDKNNISIDTIFIHGFEKQVQHIKIECIYYWQAVCKIEKWLLWCYWNPQSPFRKKKIEMDRQLFINYSI
tara:strand:- start:440 stop:1267 length:828 start_codon:yes stop_codon:yes gene_type:complete